MKRWLPEIVIHLFALALLTYVIHGAAVDGCNRPPCFDAAAIEGADVHNQEDQP